MLLLSLHAISVVRLTTVLFGFQTLRQKHVGLEQSLWGTKRRLSSLALVIYHIIDIFI